MKIECWICGLVLFLVVPCIADGPESQPVGKATKAVYRTDDSAATGDALQNAQELLRKLRMADPRRYQRLVELRQHDPEAFRRKLLAQVRNKHGGADEERAVQEAKRRFWEAKDDATRAQRKAELRAALEAAFEARLTRSRQRVQRLEQALVSFRARIARMEQNRDAVCTARLKKMTTSRKAEQNTGGRMDSGK